MAPAGVQCREKCQISGETQGAAQPSRDLPTPEGRQRRGAWGHVADVTLRTQGRETLVSLLETHRKFFSGSSLLARVVRVNVILPGKPESVN